MDLVVGATGYIGSLLTRALVADGREVRALSRDPSRLPAGLPVEPARGDVLSGEGIDAALDGCDAAYYLVHSMEPGAESFEARDRRAAGNFAGACARAGVGRVVYLGGIEPSGRLSPHMRSRLEVERILMDALPEATGLRASIVIGARCDSFRIMVRLAERLPALPLPPWRVRRTQPIAERDIIACLVRTPLIDSTAGRSIDLVGAGALTYEEMMDGIVEELGIGRPHLGLPVFTAPAFGAVAAAVAGADTDLVVALMGSLNADVLPRSEGAAREMAELYGLEPMSYSAAVRRALRDWEREEPLAAR
jgi:uncharacterized protein YbjT (DUF2867 family)